MEAFDLDCLEYDWSANERRMLKYMFEADGMLFMRYFFKLRESNKMIVNWHHYVIEFVLQAVIDGLINRLIINVSPGYTKTEQAVLNFICRGLALNSRAKFIHTSYSGDLANENSSKIRDTIRSPEFQELWPMKIRVDSTAKKRWFTAKGGGMMAAPSAGQITGFRAGRMEEGFTGAFINDDPVKPDDAFSDAKRNAINNRFNNTMRSRLAVETVPMINIMQRIHETDLTGFLLRGGSGDIWHHLVLPARIDDEFLTKKYNEDYTHGIPLDINEILNCVRTGGDYDFEL